MHFIDLKDTFKKQLAPGVTSSLAWGDKLMLSVVELDPGSTVPMHRLRRIGSMPRALRNLLNSPPSKPLSFRPISVSSASEIRNTAGIPNSPWTILRLAFTASSHDGNMNAKRCRFSGR